MQMPKPERPAYDVENRQNPSVMRQRVWNTMSLLCVRDVKTSVSLEGGEDRIGEWATETFLETAAC